MKVQRKQFFFEKRTKKLLLIQATVVSPAKAKGGDFFWFRSSSLGHVFFQKKNVFLA